MRTARLSLRPIAVADAAEVFAYASDPAVLRYTTARTPTRLAQTEAWLREVVAEPRTYMWAIRERTGGPVVGAIEFNVLSPTLGSTHYGLAVPFWGRGLMTEAVRAVCAWAFAFIPALAAIETSVAAANAGSARVLEKCGFRRTRELLETWEKEPEPVRLWAYRLARADWSRSPTAGAPGDAAAP